MLDRSGIESEAVTHSIIPDDPYQLNAEEAQRSEAIPLGLLVCLLNLPLQ